jgi:hypothetical protein
MATEPRTDSVLCFSDVRPLAGDVVVVLVVLAIGTPPVDVDAE